MNSERTVDDIRNEINVDLGILTRARELLIKGWCQFVPFKQGEKDLFFNSVKLGTPFDSCDMNGAIIYAFFEKGYQTTRNFPDFTRVCRRVLDALNGSHQTLHQFNDAQGRTQEEVLRAVEKAMQQCNLDLAS